MNYECLSNKNIMSNKKRYKANTKVKNTNHHKQSKTSKTHSSYSTQFNSCLYLSFQWLEKKKIIAYLISIYNSESGYCHLTICWQHKLNSLHAIKPSYKNKWGNLKVIGWLWYNWVDETHSSWTLWI